MARFLFYDDMLINILSKEEKPSGGAAVQAYGWIRGLSEENQEVYVMTNTKPVEEIKQECRDIKLVPLFDRSKGVRWLRWIYYRFPFIYKQIKDVRPDYLYQGIPSWSSFLLGIICKNLKIKYVLRISNDYLLDDRILKKFSKSHRFFMDQGMKLAHCILCQNDYQYNIILKKFPSKLALKIANPIFQKYNGNLNTFNSRKYIAWIGIFQYQKNMKLLFEIASCFRDQEFQIAGKQDAKCDSESLEYIEKLKGLPNVKIVGFLSREAILTFISNARFLLNTSHYEGFSNTFLEAMSAGTPIISSENVNPDAIITRNSLGLIYKDIHDLEIKLNDLSPLIYNQMTANCLQFVLKHHDYRTLSGRLLNYLDGQSKTWNLKYVRSYQDRSIISNLIILSYYLNYLGS